MSYAKVLLELARARLVVGWTKDVSARDSSGKEVPADSTNATCWCATGALFFAKVTVPEERQESERESARAIDALFDAVPTEKRGVRHCNRVQFVEYFNDHCVISQEEALAWFDRAIERVDS